MKNILWAALAILMFFAGYCVNGTNKAGEDVRQIDTVFAIDTLRDTVLQPKDSVVVRWKTRKVPVVDTVTLNIHDSIYTLLPVIQKIYGDSSYTAWVSGVDPTLDSIHIYRQTRTVSITKPQYITKRWGIGLQVGVGYGKNGVAPYIGVGVSYNLWNF